RWTSSSRTCSRRKSPPSRKATARRRSRRSSRGWVTSPDAVTIVNEWLGLAFDVLLYPFRQLSPIVGLSIASLLTAAAMLLVFRATSDQRRIEQVKRALVAALFEIR